MTYARLSGKWHRIATTSASSDSNRADVASLIAYDAAALAVSGEVRTGRALITDDLFERCTGRPGP